MAARAKVERKPIKATTAWAIRGVSGLLLHVSLGRRRDCIREFVEGGERMRYSEVLERWQKCLRDGYRPIKVRISAVD